MKWLELIKEIDKMEGWRYVIGDSAIDVCNAEGVKTYCKYEAIEAHDSDTIIDQCKKGGKLPFKVYPKGYEYRHERRSATADTQEDLTVD